jgi:hypothetical protein
MASSSKRTSTATDPDKGKTKETVEIKPQSQGTRTGSLLVANSSDLSSIERLLKKFPTTEMESRMIKDDKWSDTLFILREEGNQKLITLPKNIESFADNLFMIAIVKLCVLMNWTIQLSTKDMPTAVVDSPENAFIAGFIAGASLKVTGARVKGSTRFTKGIQAFQTFSVEKEMGKQPHLRTGGMDALLQRLSLMKGFTKDYWGIRGSLAALFRQIPPVKVSEIQTFMLPKSDIMKAIRTKLSFENGGLFRSQEIAYFNERYAANIQTIRAFNASLDTPSEDLAKTFTTKYAAVKTLIDSIDSSVKLIAINRSKILFPEGKKKAITKFKAKPLLEKIELLEEDKRVPFLPESLPGISRDGTSQHAEGTITWKRAVYSSYTSESAKEIIDSWWSTFPPEEEE